MMKFLSFFILCYIVPVLLSLRCYKYDPKYNNQTEIEVCDPDEKNLTCVVIMFKKSDGTSEVEFQDCYKIVGQYCLTYTFCNDRDYCNEDGSDTTFDPTVKSRKCRCHHVSDPPHKRMNQRNREDNHDCATGSDQIECNATALLNETAFCIYGTDQREHSATKFNQLCGGQFVNNGPLIYSRLDYSCNTDLCNVPTEHCGAPFNYSTTSSSATASGPTTIGPLAKSSTPQPAATSTYPTTTNTGSVATTDQTARSQTPSSATTGPSTKSSTLQSYVSSTSTYPASANTRSVAKTDETTRPQTPPSSASNGPHYAVFATVSSAILIAKVLG